MSDEKRVPKGWSKVGKYAMKRGIYSLCIVYISGAPHCELYKGDGAAIFRGLMREGAYETALKMVDDNMSQKAAA